MSGTQGFPGIQGDPGLDGDPGRPVNKSKLRSAQAWILTRGVQSCGSFAHTNPMMCYTHSIKISEYFLYSHVLCMQGSPGDMGPPGDDGFPGPMVNTNTTWFMSCVSRISIIVWTGSSRVYRGSWSRRTTWTYGEGLPLLVARVC